MDESTPWEGEYGRAEKLELKDGPEWSETVATYLLSAPYAHPFWSQYLLMVVRLREKEGMPPPVLQFEGASHELMVLALHPDGGPYTADGINGLDENSGPGALPWLEPASVVVQMEATDAEIEQVADLCAKSVAHGALSPEAPFGLGSHNLAWKTSITKTLAHIRGEEHAS